MSYVLGGGAGVFYVGDNSAGGGGGGSSYVSSTYVEQVLGNWRGDNVSIPFRPNGAGTYYSPGYASIECIP